MQKVFELFSIDQFLQKLFFKIGRKRNGIDKLLANSRTYPFFFFLVLDVAVFDTDFAAIGFLKNFENTP